MDHESVLAELKSTICNSNSKHNLHNLNLLLYPNGLDKFDYLFVGMQRPDLLSLIWQFKLWKFKWIQFQNLKIVSINNKTQFWNTFVHYRFSDTEFNNFWFYKDTSTNHSPPPPFDQALIILRNNILILQMWQFSIIVSAFKQLTIYPPNIKLGYILQIGILYMIR